MKSNVKVKLFFSLLLLVLFELYTMAVTKIDVAPIGPEGSLVGFSTINGYFAKAIGFNELLYNITDYLGYIALLVCGFFGLIGLIQLIKGKSLKKVDPDIYVLGAFYVVVILFYVIFEKVIINYRPVILEEGLEASYPSSHTMLAVCVFTTAIMQFKTRIKNPTLLTVAEVVFYIMLVVTVAGRLLSGVHWFTDIVGGLLLSSALVCLYSTLVEMVKK